MCGVFGWIKFNRPFSEPEKECARKAVRLMAHRGPDFQGEWVKDNIYMGHRRLSIIDLSAEANQPFMEEGGRYVACFNGEIYNYIELREEMKKRGIAFRTSSDIEVLIKCYMAMKEKAFLKFDGMFAGAVHDANENIHYLFRDYLGQKPLYYFEYQNGIVYASELRSILDLDYFRWELDLNNFVKYLMNSYYIGETTPVKYVKKLLPGHFLKIDLSNKRTTLYQFWNSIPGENSLDIDFPEAVRETQRLLDHSCKISMRADVPYGVFLSGGVDSSLILESCRRTNPKIASYSVSMCESDFDESPKANAVNRYLKIENSETYVMGKTSVGTSLGSFYSFIDEPHGDPGYVNSYFLSKSCKPEITVALGGDGADELFAGYVPFLALKGERLLNNLSSEAVSFLRSLTKRIFPVNDRYLGYQFKALSFLQGFPSDSMVRFPLWLGALSLEQLKMLCPWQDDSFFSSDGGDGTILEDSRKTLVSVEGKSRVQMLLYFYQKFVLPEFVCHHSDRAAMQNSLEVRSPYLSVSLIEFANRLPDAFKLSNNKMKKVLKSMMQAYGFPDHIYKQRKQGFTFPIARWLKTNLKDDMGRILSKDMWENQLIDHVYVEHLKGEHLKGKCNNYRILFNLMVFKKWHQNFPQVQIPL